MTDTPRATPDVPIAILGAGFAGIGTAIQLKRAGIEHFVMFERASEVGGTWRDNTYPGAACDVPSHVYSFSFEQNPDWSSTYAGSDEIQRYLLHCVEKHGLRSKLRLDTEIVSAVFDEDAGFWTLTTNHGDTLTARVVVSGVGGLVDPAYPDIKGIQSFTGEMFHTARWNHEFDLRGKNVGVIGTGASAIQVVPAIAPEVSKLSVFQRTAAWIMPKREAPYTDAAKRRYARFPLLQRAHRLVLFWLSEMTGPLIWLHGRLSKIGERGSLKHLEASVSDPELREKLTPEFEFGCKRVLISDDYWPSLERENVELVTSGISEIRSESIVTEDGREHPLDALVLATGFDLGITASSFPVAGLGGKTLGAIWEKGAEAYKGMTVAGIPNWFIIMGPNTGPGHTSVLVYTEAQIAYILQAIQAILAQDLKWISVKQDVQDVYNEKIQARMPRTSWSAGGCNSWYLSDGGKNHALFPGFATEYVLGVRKFKLSEFDSVEN